MPALVDDRYLVRIVASLYRRYLLGAGMGSQWAGGAAWAFRESARELAREVQTTRTIERALRA